MKAYSRHAVTLYATQSLLDWVKSVKPHLDRWTLETINHRPSVYLVEVEDQNCHGMALEKYYTKIVENELAYLYIDRTAWPEPITFELFLMWFSYQYHEDIYELCKDELKVYEA